MDAVLEMAKELMAVKRHIRQLCEIERVLKDKLKPHLEQLKRIKLEDGRIYYAESRRFISFKRAEVLKFLRENYGEPLADQVDEACSRFSEPRGNVYVQLFRAASNSSRSIDGCAS